MHGWVCLPMSGGMRGGSCADRLQQVCWYYWLIKWLYLHGIAVVTGARYCLIAGRCMAI